jgi:tRNA/tmRNA/rRNA uracil-C5-methylase (TrmA/RlmC/RlmD family)
MKPKRITELYSGAGTIGLALANAAEDIVGMEIVPAAVELANRNATENGITNYRAECIAAEHIPTDHLSETDVLILDPPRAGLHPKAIKHILEARPTHILYLSCNFQTQAADYAKLAAAYRATHLSGFDFYPNTPHMESLLVLTL